ncbi:MAG TPA: hypothetical protein VJ852_08205 [Gemmatimonadaceae bacterium]|nr:hypothetical protein [Gemmatimonadaceae bacterium]
MMKPGAFLLGALAACVCGCYNWSPTEMPPTGGALPGNPKQVQVTRVDGAFVTLRDPVISADSLVGFTYIRGQGNVRLAIPKTDIKSLNASTFSSGRTAGLVVGIAAAAAGALYLALRNSDLQPIYTPNLTGVH